jgi:nickel-dependent lactate racemase
MVQYRRIEIPYGEEQISFSVPEENLKGVYIPHKVAPVADVAAEIIRALSNPVASPSLTELARGSKHVVIVADDMTRPTPTDIILPEVLDAINAAGVADDAIQLLIALGTHRKMTAKEIEVKYGSVVPRRIQVVNHDAFDPEVLVQMGTTQGGIPVMLNRMVVGADLVLGIGSIVPHHIPGFSGGAKIIQPGICGMQTTGEVHLLSVRSCDLSMLGILENEVRHEMEAIAERAGLHAILNTVLDAEGRVVKAVFGDPRAAFREGVEQSRRVYGVSVKNKTDIVIAGSHPCDIEFWQAHKCLYAAECCVREGGTIIIVTPCPEGVAVTHPEMVQFAGRSLGEIDAMVRSGEIKDVVAGALAMAWANTRRRARICLVSSGISDKDAKAVSFTPFATVDEALEDALARHGQQALVCVLPYAPDTLPLIN